MNQFKLAPSILSADFNKLGEEIRAVENSGLELLHIDVMDGNFVPSISYGMPVIKSIRNESDLFFDVHLMIEDPGRYISDFVNAGANGITVHAEACTHLNRVIGQIKEAGVKAAVALNPATPIDVLRYVEEDLDMILLMTVNPGFGGQKFIPQSMQKIRELRAHLSERGLSTDIQVDGGIKAENIREVADAGATIFVAGSSVFHGDIAKNIKALQDALQ